MSEEQKKLIDMSRAFGLMRGACEGLALRLPASERFRIEKLMHEADELWQGKKDDPADD